MQACQSAESTPGDPGKLAMMERVGSSRSTSGGVEVARRGVAGRLQPTLGTGPDVRVRNLQTYNRTTLPTSSDDGGDE